MTDPVGTDRAAFEAWLATDGGKRAVEQIRLAFPCACSDDEPIRSSLWFAYVHAWHAREREGL